MARGGEGEWLRKAKGMRVSTNVGRRRGRVNQDPVRGGRAGKRATNSARGGRGGKRGTDSAPRDEGGRNPKRAKKVADEIGSSGPPPRNRESPSRLFILNSGLDDTQKDAIGDISFGGVLDIGTRTMKGDLLKFVTKCYDPERSQLIIPDRGKIPVDVASVERIWGLPRGAGKVAYEVVEPDLVMLYNEMFDIPTGPAPSVTEWCKMINDMGAVADDKFLSAWLVVVYSCFLAPTTSLKVSPRAYSAALNPREVVNSNVCQFVVDQLRLAFMGLGDKKNTICCCLFHLVLLYLDSLDVDFRTVHKDYVDERTTTVLPRVKAWNEGLIKAVIKKDKIRKGVYGKLRLKAEFSRCAEDSVFGSMDHIQKFVAARLPQN
uniref:Aminotransferase-like plant mobile domain-containing protein n=1 Tax=Aegilops tauschii TaxID=37682 RepID=M8BTM3_AEGTA